MLGTWNFSPSNRMSQYLKKHTSHGIIIVAIMGLCILPGLIYKIIKIIVSKTGCLHPQIK
jgi:hypothetical protein